VSYANLTSFNRQGFCYFVLLRHYDSPSAFAIVMK
jgi:hypothetical protein